MCTSKRILIFLLVEGSPVSRISFCTLSLLRKIKKIPGKKETSKQLEKRRAKMNMYSKEVLGSIEKNQH